MSPAITSAEVDSVSTSLSTSATPQTAGAFDLAEFADILESGDLAGKIATYAEHAEVRIIDPDNPPGSPHVHQGRAQIEAAIRSEACHTVACQVLNMIDGGDRIAFTELRQYRDGSHEIATSTAELSGGRIATQHAVVVWDPCG